MKMPADVRHDIEVDMLPIPMKWSALGYHYCTDWDGMLIGPHDPEWDACLCRHPSSCRNGSCED